MFPKMQIQHPPASCLRASKGKFGAMGSRKLSTPSPAHLHSEMYKDQGGENRKKATLREGIRKKGEPECLRGGGVKKRKKITLIEPLRRTNRHWGGAAEIDNKKKGQKEGGTDFLF